MLDPNCIFNEVGEYGQGYHEPDYCRFYELDECDYYRKRKQELQCKGCLYKMKRKTAFSILREYKLMTLDD